MPLGSPRDTSLDGDPAKSDPSHGQQSERSSRDNCEPLPPLINRLLPIEILTQVFIEVCRNTGLGPLYYTHLAPVTILALVCPLWRDIAIPNPTLWSSFRFTAGDSFRTDTTRNMLPILRLFLQRSYPSDLAVCAQIQERSQDDSCFNELALHSERWGHLHLDIFPRLISKLNTVKNRVSALKTLSLQTNLVNRGLQSNDVVDAFEYAPQLRNFATRGSMSSALRIPWDQITDLSFDPPDATGMEWAQQCSNLRSLTVYPTSLRNVDITHPLLHELSLSLGLFSPPDGLRILTCFTMPNLLSLHIKSFSATKPFAWFHSAFLAFVARSPPFALRELAFVNVYTDMTAPQLIECLQVLPSLQTLKIIESCRNPLFAREICQALTRRPSEGRSMHLAPMLTTLHLTEDEGQRSIIDPESLVEMVESRVPDPHGTGHDAGLASLTSLTLGAAVFWARPGKHAAMVMMRFTLLEERGLRISVIPPGPSDY
ncbi:hypothetical protein D9615_007073 [Tricholomella constricta]|uniref:F-box domain-containing protein n=1 Tax=Tricholomella constricta TaxID=117010 RepID=A0A8H5H7T7_9AGAR|nr:hypothetical protein D9615_007073 [Tricholomella constricta]